MSVILTPRLPGEGLERLLGSSSRRADLLFPSTAVSKGLSLGETGRTGGKKKKRQSATP